MQNILYQISHNCLPSHWFLVFITYAVIIYSDYSYFTGISQVSRDLFYISNHTLAGYVQWFLHFKTTRSARQMWSCRNIYIEKVRVVSVMARLKTKRIVNCRGLKSQGPLYTGISPVPSSLKPADPSITVRQTLTITIKIHINSDGLT